MNQPRLGRREAEQDAFITTVNRVLDFARERAIPLAFVGAVVAVLIVGGAWYASRQFDRRAEEFVTMFEASAKFDEALDAAGEERGQLLDQVAQELQRIEIPRYRLRAQFLAAHALLEKGEAAEAGRRFQALARAENGSLGLFAQIGYGAALEVQEDWEGALNAYDEAALSAYRSAPGYDVAWVDAAFGRGRAARRLGRPDLARAAYRSVVERHRQARDAALQAREQTLNRRIREFIQEHQGAAAGADLLALSQRLDEWIRATLQKPEAQQRGLDEAVRLLDEADAYRSALVEARRAEARGDDDSALFSYQTAVGEEIVVPTFDHYRRALLELERLGSLGLQPQAEGTQPASVPTPK
ncbi:MAG: hypothetical protein KatS3mg115_0529 [Candidatus Poribacteria bacterium]|nr:MAG: hypothetical protein KatS3mg115_0529 [Candidatus Poribacteria bacterium]